MLRTYLYLNRVSHKVCTVSLTAGTGRSAGEVLEELSGIVSLLPVLIGPATGCGRKVIINYEPNIHDLTNNPIQYGALVYSFIYAQLLYTVYVHV